MMNFAQTQNPRQLTTIAGWGQNGQYQQIFLHFYIKPIKVFTENQNLRIVGQNGEIWHTEYNMIWQGTCGISTLVTCYPLLVQVH